MIATNQLRWKQTKVRILDEDLTQVAEALGMLTHEIVTVLQQWWAPVGAEPEEGEWRDVPVVKE
jgi:hypothetical protein